MSLHFSPIAVVGAAKAAASAQHVHAGRSEVLRFPQGVLDAVICPHDHMRCAYYAHASP